MKDEGRMNLQTLIKAPNTRAIIVANAKVCDVCQKVVKANNIARHRKQMHGITIKSKGLMEWCPSCEKWHSRNMRLRHFSRKHNGVAQLSLEDAIVRNPVTKETVTLRQQRKPIAIASTPPPNGLSSTNFPSPLHPDISRATTASRPADPPRHLNFLNLESSRGNPYPECIVDLPAYDCLARIKDSRAAGKTVLHKLRDLINGCTFQVCTKAGVWSDAHQDNYSKLTTAFMEAGTKAWVTWPPLTPAERLQWADDPAGSAPEADPAQ